MLKIVYCVRRHLDSRRKQPLEVLASLFDR